MTLNGELVDNPRGHNVSYACNRGCGGHRWRERSHVRRWWHLAEETRVDQAQR